MKIGDPTYRGAEVHLPVEVLSLITAHLASSNNVESQKSLWACCLVSQTWYTASISHLYYRPHLSPQNFDLFAQIICPPLKARKTLRLGLEGMIKHLDMREIAYESWNSRTSRLISRTKSSLESLRAPTVTFSVAALAPLSKCLNLRLLDLSGDRYSIMLSELLSSIRNLELLTSLGLPKDILCDDWPLPPVLRWPPNLVRLRAPGAICNRPQSWDTLCRSWPTSLKTLQFPDYDYLYGSPFARFEDCRETAGSIQRLEIDFTPRQAARPVTGTLFDILHVFPSLKEVTIPDVLARNTLVGRYNPAIEEAACDHSALEILVVTGHAAGQASLGFHVDAQPHAELCFITLPRLLKLPKLRRLVISESFISRNSEEKEKVLNILSEVLERRASPELQESSGFFVLEEL